MLECFALKKIIIVLAPAVEGEVEKDVGRKKSERQSWIESEVVVVGEKIIFTNAPIQQKDQLFQIRLWYMTYNKLDLIQFKKEKKWSNTIHYLKQIKFLITTKPDDD